MKLYLNQRDADAILTKWPRLVDSIVVLHPAQDAERDEWVKSINSRIKAVQAVPENPANPILPNGLASHSKGR